MSKNGVKQLTNIFASHMNWKDTSYRKAILVLIWVALALYKETQRARLLHVRETFAVWKSTMYCIIKDFIFIVNVELRSKINSPKGAQLMQTIRDFKEYCGLFGVMGAIDWMHFAIKKSNIALEDNLLL